MSNYDALEGHDPAAEEAIKGSAAEPEAEEAEAESEKAPAVKPSKSGG